MTSRVDMCIDLKAENQGPDRARARKPILRRFARSQDGAAAIEFAILSIPYFLIVFAILETFIAFIGEQVVSNGVEVMARKVRTGEIRSTSANDPAFRTTFRTAFCNEISIMISCSASEIATPSKLYLDLRSFSTYADIPTSIPRQSSAQYADLKTSDFGYSPGGAKSINMLRAYYRWPVITDLVRPLLTSVRTSDGSSSFLIVATATFQNEDYP
jgi:Flp pilus assembly protein TadG